MMHYIIHKLISNMVSITSSHSPEKFSHPSSWRPHLLRFKSARAPRAAPKKIEDNNNNNSKE
jgi:hypothetical protein